MGAQLRRVAVEPERREAEVGAHVHALAHVLREAHAPEEVRGVLLVLELARLRARPRDQVAPAIRWRTWWHVAYLRRVAYLAYVWGL